MPIIREAIKHFLFFQDHDDNYARKVISKCDACLLVYDVCDRYSFDYACSVAQKIRQPTKSNNTYYIPILLAGNKTDLEHFRLVVNSFFLIWVKIQVFYTCIRTPVEFSKIICLAKCVQVYCSMQQSDTSYYGGTHFVWTNFYKSQHLD